MPLYDYRCRDCSNVTEVRHGSRDAYEGTCPTCGGGLARVFNPAGIVFKGSGFYVNDSRKKPASEGSSASSSSSTTSGSDAKPAAASESTAEPAAAATPASGGDAGAKKSESSAA